MTTTICVKVSKGGVGKTTVVSNLSDTLATQGHKVLVIDLDPQSNLSSSLFGQDSSSYLSSSNLLGDNLEHPENLLIPIKKNLDLIKSDMGLGQVSNFLLQHHQNPYNRLEEAITQLNLHEKYEYIILDLSPGVADIITDIAMVASDLLLCPTHFDVDSLTGLILTIQTLSKLEENNLLKKHINYLVVPNRYDLRFKKDNQEIFNLLYENIDKEFIASPIRENSHIKKARMRGISAIEYEALKENKYEHTRATQDFEKLAQKIKELLQAH